MSPRKADKSQLKTISSNLMRLMNSRGVTQAQIAQILNVSEGAVSNWISCNNAPSMGNIQRLAEHFSVAISDLLEERDDNKQWYLNPETQEVAQEIAENKELSLLFDAARDATPDDLRLAQSMLLALKRKERGEE